MASTTTDSLPPKQLKRLGFVHSSASYVYGYTTTAEQLYRRVRSAVPTSVVPTLSKLEERVASVAAPLVARAQDAGAKALYLADDQVDYLLTTADKTYSTSKKGVTDSIGGLKSLHETNYKTFQETSQAYYAWVQQFADWAKDKLNPIKGGQAALDTLHAAIEKAKEATDPDVAAKLATDAWTSFASVPLVAKVLETADPVTKAALQSFYSLHDTVVSWTLYKKVVDTGASTLVWATGTTPYKLGATYVYPLVQPVADPALDKLSHSKVVKEAIGYWKPTATAA